jgi:uncharacterized protein YndB with AHSA1/START domain
MTATAVRLTRTIPASPEQVYRAWLDPDLLRQWMWAGSNRVTRVEVDERVGGHFSIFQANPGGDSGGFEAELIDLDPDRRIVWRWSFVGPERVADPSHDSRLTVTFADDGSGATELTLVHERLEPFAAAMPEVAAKVETGWATALDNLAGALERQPARSSL